MSRVFLYIIISYTLSFRNLFGDEIADGGGSNTITQEQYKERSLSILTEVSSLMLHYSVGTVNSSTT